MKAANDAANAIRASAGYSGGTNGNSISVSSGKTVNTVIVNQTTTVTNSGTIYTVNVLAGATSTITNSGTIGTINNSGTITNLTNTGYVGTINNGGIIGTINNNGSIGSINNNSGTIGTINNSGNITSVNNNGSITTINNNSGTVGNIVNNNSIGKINNSASIGTINNNGTINSIKNTGSISTIVNKGTIKSTSGIIPEEKIPGGGATDPIIDTKPIPDWVDRILNSQGTVEDYYHALNTDISGWTGSSRAKIEDAIKIAQEASKYMSYEKYEGGEAWFYLLQTAGKVGVDVLGAISVVAAVSSATALTGPGGTFVAAGLAETFLFATVSAGFNVSLFTTALIYTIDNGGFIEVTISPDSSNEFFNVVGPNFSYNVPLRRE